MAVVKNMMVRVGADLSGLISGFKKGGGATGNFAKQASDALRSVTLNQANLKKAMAQGGKNEAIVSLVDQIRELEEEQKALKAAGFSWGYEGFEGNEALLRSLKAELQDYEVSLDKATLAENEMRAALVQKMDSAGANENIVNLTHQIKNLEAEQKKLRELGFGWGFHGFEDNEAQLRSLKTEVKEYAKAQAQAAEAAEVAAVKANLLGGYNSRITSLVDHIRELEAEQKTLKGMGISWGYEEFEANEQILRDLKAELQDYIRTQEQAGEATEDTVRKTNRLGVAASAAGGWLKKAGAWILSLGPKAKYSAGSMESLVRSIRRLGIVSLSLRFVKAIFGELGTITRQYIAENATLQAQVNALRSSFGQALAPAINIVTNALAALMPYVVGVSNAIGSLLGALAGGWGSVAAEASSAATAIAGAGGAQKDVQRSLQGFDEITKLDSKSSGGGGSGNTPTVEIKPVLPEWLENFVAQVKEKIQSQDWPGVGNIIIEGISLGVGAAGGSILAFVRDKIWTPFIDYFRGYIEKNQEMYGIGGDIFLGIMEGCYDAVKNVGSWLKEHVVTPFVDGFKRTFKIHSPSTHPEITGIGKNIMLGVFGGLLEPLKDPVGWIKEHVFKPLSEGFQKVFGGGIGGLFSGSVEGGTMEMDVQANFTKWKDELRNKVIDFQSRLSTWKDNLKNKTVDFQSRLTTWKDSLRDKAVTFQSNLTTWKDSLQNKVVTFQSNLTSWKDSLQNKTVSFQSNLTSWKDSLQNKVVTFQSNLTSWKDSLQNKTVSFQSNLTTWKDSLKDKAVTFQSNLTTWKDNLEDKAVSFTSNLTSWKDNLKDKTLSFAAGVTKGWDGKLEDVLGISNLYSKLNIKTPDVTVTWSTSYANPSDPNSASVQSPNYHVAYNAKGGIFNAASMFGMLGNTFQVAGEAGREALLPLDRNTWWMDKIADKVALKVVGGGQSGDQSITVNIPLDGKVLASAVVRHINAQARATGKNPLAAYL